MIHKNINKFKSSEFRKKTILAIDFGSKKLGIATCDEEQIIASPKTVYYRKDLTSDLNFIKSYLITYNINIILLGLALDKDGKYTQTAQKTKSFANILTNEFPNIDIFFWDERYTTVESQRLMNFHDVKDKETRKNDDAISASIILSSFLEFSKDKS